MLFIIVTRTSNSLKTFLKCYLTLYSQLSNGFLSASGQPTLRSSSVRVSPSRRPVKRKTLELPGTVNLSSAASSRWALLLLLLLFSLALDWSCWKGNDYITFPIVFCYVIRLRFGDVCFCLDHLLSESLRSPFSTASTPNVAIEYLCWTYSFRAPQEGSM